MGCEVRMLLDNTTKPWVGLYHSQKCQAVREKIKNAFSDLQFDEGPHIYTLYGEQIPSVSSVVDLFVEPFDAEKKAYGCWKKGHNDPTSKYYGMSVDEIVKSWEDNSRNSTEQGTIAHAFAESCMYYMVGEYDGILPEHKDRLVDGKFVVGDGFEQAVAQFFIDIPNEYVPILSEARVYAKCGREKAVYAGTFDLLVYAFLPNRECLIMYDYKTNGDLYKNFMGKKMLNGLEFLLDSPKNHYEVQQGAYENALNEIGLTLAGKRLVWIKPGGEYELVRLNERVIPIVIKKLLKNG